MNKNSLQLMATKTRWGGGSFTPEENYDKSITKKYRSVKSDECEGEKSDESRKLSSTLELFSVT